MLSVFLAYSADLFSENDWWHRGLDILGCVGGKEGCWSRSLDSLGMTSMRTGRPQRISCYRSGDRTGGLDLMSYRPGVVPPSAYLLPLEEWLLG